MFKQNVIIRTFLLTLFDVLSTDTGSVPALVTKKPNTLFQSSAFGFFVVRHICLFTY
jgi:hypothetical protein